METKSMTRKDFILLTFTLVGSTAMLGSSCEDDDDGGTGTGGTGGTGTGTAGSTGRGGTGGAAGQGGAGGSGGVTSCAGNQLPDTLDHVHMLSVPASALSAATDQSFNTTLADGHVHPVTLSAADLSTLSNGGAVTVTSGLADGHVHMYMVTCA